MTATASAETVAQGDPDAAALGEAEEERAAIIVVSREAGTREILSQELSKRYGADYQVMACDRPGQLASWMRDLRAAGLPVAMVIGSVGAQDPDGIRELATVRAINPAALRVAALDWGDWASVRSVFDAVTLGTVDHYVIRPVQAPAEEFHRSITEFLREWGSQRGGGFEPVQVIGTRWSARSQELRDLFARHRVPAGFYDAASWHGQQLLHDLSLESPELPVVVLQFAAERSTLVNPTNQQIADAFGVMTPISAREVFDVAVIGAGPAGLAAAVGAASEGLRTVVVEHEAVGGQAGTSSMIRNYPGFSQGIRGAMLAQETWRQAWAFGTTFLYMRRAQSLSRVGGHYRVGLSDGGVLAARTVIIATGVAYRRLGIPDLESLQGRGVFYGTAVSEAPAMRGRRVFVAGGGNSAGQAALHLARWARQVTILVRAPSLAASMSDYLVRQIGATPNIDVRYRVQVTDGTGTGTGHLQSLVLQGTDSGALRTVPADALFVLIGAQPRTEWLGEAVARDRWGFILTGPDLPDDIHARWTAARPPLPLETSLPGIFAVGDVHRGSVKRVASAVGEGAAAIPLVHRYLARDAAGREAAVPAARLPASPGSTVAHTRWMSGEKARAEAENAVNAITSQSFSTRRLTLVPLLPGHADEMAAVLADPALYAFTGGSPPTRQELRARYERWAAGSPDPAVSWCNWVIRLRSPRCLAGTVQATISTGHRPRAEVAWVVGATWQGQGIATEAARALVSWLREHAVRTVIAHIHPRHEASAAVAAAAGLTPTGQMQDGEMTWRLTMTP